MSTRSSIWLGEDEGKTVHIYFELNEREVGTSRFAAPVYIEITDRDDKRKVTFRLPKEIATHFVTGLGDRSEIEPL